MMAETMQAAAQSNPSAASLTRALPVKLALLALVVYLVAVAVAPTAGRVVGIYGSPSDNGLIQIEVRSDGTYIEYDQTQEIARGRWRLKNRFYVLKSLVLENAFALPVDLDDLRRGKVEVSYLLYHRAGDLCFRPGPDPEYWCKEK